MEGTITIKANISEVQNEIVSSFKKQIMCQLIDLNFKIIRDQISIKYQIRYDGNIEKDNINIKIGQILNKFSKDIQIEVQCLQNQQKSEEWYQKITSEKISNVNQQKLNKNQNIDQQSQSVDSGFIQIDYQKYQQESSENFQLLQAETNFQLEKQRKKGSSKSQKAITSNNIKQKGRLQNQNQIQSQNSNKNAKQSQNEDQTNDFAATSAQLIKNFSGKNDYTVVFQLQKQLQDEYQLSAGQKQQQKQIKSKQKIAKQQNYQILKQQISKQNKQKQEDQKQKNIQQANVQEKVKQISYKGQLKQHQVAINEKHIVTWRDNDYQQKQQKQSCLKQQLNHHSNLNNQSVKQSQHQKYRERVTRISNFTQQQTNKALNSNQQININQSQKEQNVEFKQQSQLKKQKIAQNKIKQNQKLDRSASSSNFKFLGAQQQLEYYKNLKQFTYVAAFILIALVARYIFTVV